VWVAAVACLLGGAGGGLFGVLWETALAERIAPHLLSRVTAYDWMGSLALLPLGYLIAGPVGEAVGAQDVLLAGSIAGLVFLALGLLPRSTWTLQRLDAAPKSGSPSSVVEASA
jgi:MFS family permease